MKGEKKWKGMIQNKKNRGWMKNESKERKGRT